MPNKKTMVEVKKLFEDNGWTLISTVYISSNKPLEAICPMGCVTTKTYSNLRNGVISCKLCTNKKNALAQTIPFEEKKKLVEKEKGYTLLGEIRIKCGKIALIVSCDKKHIYNVCITDFKKGCRCKKCKNLWADLEGTIKLFKEKGWTYLDGQYTNAYTKLTVRCPKGHKQFKSRADINGSNDGCVHCLKRLQEKECRDIFEKLLGVKFDCVWPEFLRNPDTNRRLQLDGYNEELNLAFEYDGRLHYVGYYGKDVLVGQKNRDRLKEQLCKKEGVVLIRVPYFEKNKEEYIKDQLKKRGISWLACQ